MGLGWDNGSAAGEMADIFFQFWIISYYFYHVGCLSFHFWVLKTCFPPHLLCFLIDSRLKVDLYCEAVWQ